MARDPFGRVADVTISPATRSQFVDGSALSADLELDRVSKGFRCAAAGVLVCRLVGDGADISLALAVGESVDLRVSHVRQATTADVHFWS